MRIRPIRAEDDQQVYQLIRQDLEEFGIAEPGTAYADPYLPHLTAYYASHQPSAYWVLYEEAEPEKPLGSGGIAPIDFEHGICELQKLYLLPEARGKGGSKLIMEAAITYATQHYRQVYIESRSELKTALKLYQRYGFRELSGPLSQSDHHFCDHWLIKDL